MLYVHSAADRERALAMAEAALDRLGVCNRLNLALVDRGAAELLPDAAGGLSREGPRGARHSPCGRGGGDGFCPTTATASATSGRTSPTASRP